MSRTLVYSADGCKDITNYTCEVRDVDDMSEMETTKTLPSKEEYYAYLKQLRDSGRINMFGAGIYLMGEYNVSKKEANEMLFDWMKNFNGE